MNAFIWLPPLSQLEYSGLFSMFGFIIGFLGVMDTLGRFNKKHPPD